MLLHRGRHAPEVGDPLLLLCTAHLDPRQLGVELDQALADLCRLPTVRPHLLPQLAERALGLRELRAQETVALGSVLPGEERGGCRPLPLDVRRRQPVQEGTRPGWIRTGQPHLDQVRAAQRLDLEASPELLHLVADGANRVVLRPAMLRPQAPQETPDRRHRRPQAGRLLRGRELLHDRGDERAAPERRERRVEVGAAPGQEEEGGRAVGRDEERTEEDEQPDRGAHGGDEPPATHPSPRGVPPGNRSLVLMHFPSSER